MKPRYEVVFNPEGFWELRDESKTPPVVIGSDGGEPEDQSLVRDWSWVRDALEESYRQGYEDGLACMPGDGGAV